MNRQRKYKIDEEMNKLNLTTYKKALKIIPGMLGIAFNTFHNYRRMRIDAEADIPYHMVRKLELFFGLKPGGLANYQIIGKSLKQILKEERGGGRLDAEGEI